MCLTGKAGVGQHKQSRCEATRQHRPILTGVDGDDTTNTQHISRCEANPSVSVFGWWVLCVCQRCNVMTTILSLQEKSRCEATRRVNMAVGLVTHTSNAGVRCEATWQSMAQPRIMISVNYVCGEVTKT